MKKSIISLIVVFVLALSIGAYAKQQMNCGRNCPRSNYVDCPMKGNQICGYPRASTNVCQRVGCDLNTGCPRYNSCPMR